MPSTDLRENERDELLADLEGDVLAPSTSVARESNFRIWAAYHMRWFGMESPVLPLTVEAIRAVAAQMKGAGYRSFPNYLSAAKLRHCCEDEWTSVLQRAAKDAKQSTQRGIGPPRQSMELCPRCNASHGGCEGSHRRKARARGRSVERGLARTYGRRLRARDRERGIFRP